MTKRDCALIGLHVVAIAGITAGYICLYQKMEKKKSKLNLNSLDLD